MPRYLVKAAVTIVTPGWWATEPLWFWIETDASIDVGEVAACGYEVVPADGMAPHELQTWVRGAEE